jgi:Leucine-rich repeat (LRR) protein
MTTDAEQEAEKRILFALSSASTRLSLSDLGLERVPETSIARLKGLDDIDLSGNNLREVPPFVCSLKHLRVLDMADNDIQSLPLELRRNMSTLRFLDLDGNQGLALPDWLGDFRNLIVLSLEYLDLEEVPAFTERLRSLEKLFLGGNRIRQLPRWLRELRFLRRLSIERNPYLNLPAEIIQSNEAGRILDYYFRVDQGGTGPLRARWEARGLA